MAGAADVDRQAVGVGVEPDLERGELTAEGGRPRRGDVAVHQENARLAGQCAGEAEGAGELAFQVAQAAEHAEIAFGLEVERQLAVAQPAPVTVGAGGEIEPAGLGAHQVEAVTPDHPVDLQGGGVGSTGRQEQTELAAAGPAAQLDAVAQPGEHRLQAAGREVDRRAVVVEHQLAAVDLESAESQLDRRAAPAGAGAGAREVGPTLLVETDPHPRRLEVDVAKVDAAGEKGSRLDFDHGAGEREKGLVARTGPGDREVGYGHRERQRIELEPSDPHLARERRGEPALGLAARPIGKGGAVQIEDRGGEEHRRQHRDPDRRTQHPAPEAARPASTLVSLPPHPAPPRQARPARSSPAAANPDEPERPTGSETAAASRPSAACRAGRRRTFGRSS